MMLDACTRRNAVQLSEARRGAGSRPARFRIVHRAGSDRDPKPRKLAVDPSVAPSGVLTREPHNQLPDSGTGGGAARRWSASVRPVSSDQRAVPAADRLRPHEQALPAIRWKLLSERAEQDPVDQAQARSPDLPTKHRKFMPQNHDLNSVFGI